MSHRCDIVKGLATRNHLRTIQRVVGDWIGTVREVEDLRLVFYEVRDVSS